MQPGCREVWNTNDRLAVISRNHLQVSQVQAQTVETLWAQRLSQPHHLCKGDSQLMTQKRIDAAGIRVRRNSPEEADLNLIRIGPWNVRIRVIQATFDLAHVRQ